MSRRGDKTGLVARASAWLAPRWDGPTSVAEFLSKPLPRNVSWLHTLGSLLLAYIAFQFLTGILLGFYYSPGPESAYASTRYVQEELFLGRFLHHLHRYGSGFVIVTAFLHLARSYFLAAYKAPRELLWVTGVLLFVLLTLLAFTGQLLPFDQRGYWATVVGIRIASGAPVVGNMIRDLLTGGYGDIGATTLSRFYILHVCVLPFALLGLIKVHLAMLQRTGSAGPVGAGRSGSPTRPFYPVQAAKDVGVAAAGALALCLVAALVSAKETGPADPTSGTFVPRPEWYFLSHYMVLKFLPGNLLVIGTFVLPALTIGGLLLLPFIDRKPDRSFSRRRLAVAVGGLGFASIIVLTAMGIADARGGGPASVVETAGADPVERGRAYFFRRRSCRQCHTIDGIGGDHGPDLTHVARRLRADFLPQWIRNPGTIDPETEMPAFEGTEDELEDVVQFLLTRD